MEKKTLKKAKVGTRISSTKKNFLENIEKFPIIEIACQKTWITRTTYYRWLEEDEKFNIEAQQKLKIWKDLINDIAESNILSWVRDKDMKATMFWLNNNHKNYSNRPIQNQNYFYNSDPKTSKKIKDILKNFSKKDEKINK